MAIVLDNRSVADFIKDLGGISPSRVRLVPAPGTATIKDLIRANAHNGSICELVDGTLVEKVMGPAEGFLAASVILMMGSYAQRHRLGLVGAPDTMLRIARKLVRVPDVCFVSFAKLPGGKVPSETVAVLVPDLAVEILSKGNTRGEIKRKLREYFRSGVRMVWVINPRTQTGEIYTAVDQVTSILRGGNMDGGDVLPGFKLSLMELFSILPTEPKRRPRNGTKK